MSDLHIPLLLGTAREGRHSEKVAAYLLPRLKAAGISTELIDVRDIAQPAVTQPPWGPHPAHDAWRAAMEKADGLLVVTPEYNRGYPGELKLAIDALQKEYRRKPVAIAGVSSGIFGGTRVILALRQVFTYLGALPISAEMNFGNVKELFAADGSITDPSYDERIDKAIAELKWLAETLKAGRAAADAK
jgi:NAD(P)H-dependent FMN reductase